jgi:hypothetical protein
MTHRVDIKVEAPPDETKPNNHYRSSVFSISLESPLPAAKIQLLVNKLLTELTTLAAGDGATSLTKEPS